MKYKMTILAEDINERNDLCRMLHYHNYIGALSEFDEWLREQLKYNDKLTDKQAKIYQEVREKFNEVVRENDAEYMY